MKSGRLILLMIFLTMLIYGCTKLHETVGGNLTSVQVTNDSSATVLLRGVYASMEFPFTSHFQIFPLSDISTDEAIVPTRANNWDDNGIWRDLHQQKWNSTSSIVHDCFNSLSGIAFAATDMLQYNPTGKQQAEARFLRAWAMYWQLDLFDQVPFRDAGESVVKAARVRKGMEALNYIVSEITAIEPDLPIGPASRANKFAAKTLLMKCYLNKAVYTNRANPAFDVTDMNKAISLADEIINSNQYSFSKNYFDNFSPINESIGKENIFTQQSNSDGNYLVSFAWLFPLDYAQGGFNGVCTLPDFYNKFEMADRRRGTVYSYPNSPPNPGNRVNVGFLIGQQHDLNTDDLLYSGPLPVIYTPEVANIETGSNLEMPGIRPIKYAPDYLNFYPPSPATNNFVYFRLSDVLLMKAEAILRGGIPTNAPYGNTALAIVNTIRTNPSRGVSALSSLTLDDLLDERGRELWWENWRRQDMIRFEKFLLPFQEKDYQSDPKYLVFPIPDEQLAVNPNLKQNPGY